MSNDLEICLDCHGYNAIADFSPWCGECAPKHWKEGLEQFRKAAHS